MGLIGQNCRIQVNHDLTGLPAVRLPEPLSEGCLGYKFESVYSSLRIVTL